MVDRWSGEQIKKKFEITLAQAIKDLSACFNNPLELLKTGQRIRLNEYVYWMES